MAAGSPTTIRRPIPLLLTLPDELLVRVLYSLEISTLEKVACVCRHLRRIAEDEPLWRSEVALRWNGGCAWNKTSRSSWKTLGQLAHHLETEVGVPHPIVALAIQILVDPLKKTPFRENRKILLTTHPWMGAWLSSLIREGKRRAIAFPTTELCARADLLAQVQLKAFVAWLTPNKTQNPYIAKEFSRPTLCCLCKLIGYLPEGSEIFSRVYREISALGQSSLGYEQLAFAISREKAYAGPAAEILLLVDALEEAADPAEKQRLVLKVSSQLAKQEIDSEHACEAIRALFLLHQQTEPMEAKRKSANRLIRCLGTQLIDIELQEQILKELFRIHGPKIGYVTDLCFLAQEVLRLEMRELFRPLLSRLRHANWEAILSNPPEFKVDPQIEEHWIVQLELHLLTGDFRGAVACWIKLLQWTKVSECPITKVSSYLFRLIEAHPGISDEILSRWRDELLTNAPEILAKIYYTRHDHLQAQCILAQSLNSFSVDQSIWFREYAKAEINAALLYLLYLDRPYELEGFCMDMLRHHPDHHFYLYFDVALLSLFQKRFELFEKYYELAERTADEEEKRNLVRLSGLADWVLEDSGPIENEDLKEYFLVIATETRGE